MLKKISISILCLLLCGCVAEMRNALNKMRGGDEFGPPQARFFLKLVDPANIQTLPDGVYYQTSNVDITLGMISDLSANTTAPEMCMKVAHYLNAKVVYKMSHPFIARFIYTKYNNNKLYKGACDAIQSDTAYPGKAKASFIFAPAEYFDNLVMGRQLDQIFESHSRGAYQFR